MFLFFCEKGGGKERLLEPSLSVKLFGAVFHSEIKSSLSLSLTQRRMEARLIMLDEKNVIVVGEKAIRTVTSEHGYCLHH